LQQSPLGRQPRPPCIDRELPVEFLRIDIANGPEGLWDASVCPHRIKSPEFLFRYLYEALIVIPARNIAGGRDDIAARLSHQPQSLRETLDISVGRHHFGAVPGEENCSRTPHPRGGTCDDDHLSGDPALLVS
jgi:hypothetical protein